MTTDTLGAAGEEVIAPSRLRALFRHQVNTAPVVPSSSSARTTFTPVMRCPLKEVIALVDNRWYWAQALIATHY